MIMPVNSRSFRLSNLALLGSGALAVAMLLTSCSGGAAAGGADDSDRLRVVATTTQLTDFAAEVGGDDIELTGLLPAGGSAHHFDPSPADLLALGNADVLIVNGVDLETFVDSAVEAAGFDGEIITAADGLDEQLLREITAESGEAHDHGHDDDHDHSHEHDEAEHADEADHADEAAHADEAEHDHADEHHDHDHGDINPHIWTSPRNASAMVSEVAKGLGEADPERENDYAERADAYLSQLSDLDTWIAEQFERVPAAERLLVSGHDSLRYYLHDYGIEFVGSILPSFEDNAEPSAAEIDELVHAIEERGVKAVFVESSMSPKLAQTIANEAGVEVVDAGSLYADSLGTEGSGADTYLGATEHNTRIILEAWGYDAD